ncbi:glucose/quinate/shikimate family membrane-bound PQQ-dependent dehydrogenase [Salinicola salarius]|uniref:glucose/quinate/shikimate family membrane-bound PQQ-dependent dehydrogenase n=1 Tax=Salinicola salarius TaxID=430457 RepID=UPI0023E3F6CA|nr:glucose/quinate/shikimate family membrane-bound PQQ-dependent dehydrogenase [Salinicola salarius]MDF3918597.1 glucose/quinate/shikimate family membrane-bound PQQ-dependent dehydrogenase [Salinicola salarius]
MKTRGALSKTRLLPSLVGLILVLLGLAMLIGGIKLSQLGGSWYYLIAGVGVGLSGLLLIAARRAAIWLFAIFLLASTIWSLQEVGLDWWQLVPRLALWFVLGIVLLLPWVRRPLGVTRMKSASAAALSIAVILAGLTAIASQFTNPHDIEGTIVRDASGPNDAVANAMNGDWLSYGGTERGQRYSPLDQITPENVGKLEEVWRYRTGDIPGPNDPSETTAENTPLKVNGKLYVCTPHSQVIALDPDSGKELWRFDPKLSTQNADSFKGWAHMTCRGVAYYEDDGAAAEPAYASAEIGTGLASPASDGAANGDATPVTEEGKQQAADQAPASGVAADLADACPRRLFLPTADTRLIALNADTGEMCPGFGDNGSIDLTRNIGSFTAGGYYSTSPPSVAHGLVIIGGHVTDNESTNEPSGVIRAYDAKDGHLVWNWDSGNPDDTTPIGPDETYTRNSPNMWSVMSVDSDLGMIYLPMGNQMPDQWGGNRTPEAEKYSAGVTALDIDTGQVRWTYQFTHHDLWDMDVGGQPSLVDIQTDEGVKPALMASTKQGSIYVLDRRTGEAIVPIHEIDAPQGAVEGDHTAATQPHSELSFSPDTLHGKDMWGVTPLDQMLCRIQFQSLRYEGMFTPPSLQGSLVYPGNFGVFDWGGIAVDPERQIAFASPAYMAFTSQLVPREQADGGERISETEGVQPNAGAPYGVIMGAFLSRLGLPCQAPPWGYVAGVDLSNHQTVWQHKNGTVRDSAPVPMPLPMGVPALGGPIMTGGGVAFLSGTLDQYLRAYDVTNGEELWKGRLPAGGQTTPMTYEGKDGRQYVLVMAGGHGSLGTKQGDYVVAYALPEGDDSN